jgi:ATPase subunit of ABC transporter with duplicated ATPase domains
MGPKKNNKSNKSNKQTNLNKKSKQEEKLKYESDSKSDSESEEEIKSKNTSTFNRFNLITSDSESETDSESEKDSDAKPDPDTKSDIVIEDVKDVKDEIKEVVDTIIYEEEVHAVKINKKMRDDIKNKKRDEKLKIGLEEVIKEKVKPMNLSTIYAGMVEILVNGVKLIGESNLVINEQTKYVVVGPNGVGKTTLIKYLHENIKNQDVLMIDQDIEIESTDQKIKDFILDANSQLHNNYKKMKEMEEIEDMTDSQVELYQALSDEVYSQNWDKYEAESNRILNGLGIENPELPVSILSGGWRMRLALGKALLRCPTVLILDEPTNHLDLNAVIWLSDYLAGYRKTLIVVTHQIHLMNTIGEVTWYIGNPELTGTKIYTVRGNYWKVQKVLENYEKENNKNYEKFIKRVEEMRKKSTPKKEVDEFIKKNGIPRPSKPYEVNIEFEQVKQLSSKNIIEMREVSFSYSYKQADNENIIFDSIEFSVSLGSKNILVGPNGAGKTTLFKLALGQIEQKNGLIIRDDRLRIGHYHQQIVDNLPLELTPIQYLQSYNEKLDNGKCRGILGKLGIKKTDSVDLPNIKISLLSGGQKARVSLAMIQMQEPHLILMDEPTNHLDIESIEGLIKGINDFNGGIILITHDMYLIESIKDGYIYELKDCKVKKFLGTFEEYCIKIIKE